jgi:hypothetical protein
MSRRTDSAFGILVGTALAALVLGSIWFRASAPCSWYGLAPVKDVPARCLMHR